MGSHDIETPPSQDILFSNILPRLPGKSVHRFMCVCKQWQSFLTTPMFAKMHHHHRHKLLIALSTTTPCKFSTIDLEAPQDGFTAGRPLPFEASHRSVSIIVSVRGLVCLRMINECNGKEYSDIILWNPLTNEYKTVSRPNNEECYVTTTVFIGLYYSCNDYKLLIVTEDHNVYIYSLKSDSWRKVETTQEDLSCLRPYSSCDRIWRQPCVLLNEKMYFVCGLAGMDLSMGSYITIIRFDMKTEKWRKIASPCVYIGDGLWKRCLSFMVVRGCIHMYVRRCHLHWKNDGHLIGVSDVAELWRMDGDGDWTKVVDTYDSPDSFFTWFRLCPLHLMKNGNWVMYYEGSPYKKIYEADLEMDTKKEVYSYSQNTIDIAGKYTETLGINMFN